MLLRFFLPVLLIMPGLSASELVRIHPDTSVLGVWPEKMLITGINSTVKIILYGYDSNGTKVTGQATNTVTFSVIGANIVNPKAVYESNGNFIAEYIPFFTGKDRITAAIDGTNVTADLERTSDGVYNLEITELSYARATDIAGKARALGGGNLAVYTSANPVIDKNQFDIYYECRKNTVVSLVLKNLHGNVIKEFFTNVKISEDGYNALLDQRLLIERGMYLLVYLVDAQGTVTQNVWKLIKN